MHKMGLIVLILTVVMLALQYSSGMSSGNRTVSPEWLTLQQSMKQMHVAMMSVAPSGNSDIDFVRLMLPHHKAAIDMAKDQLKYGRDPQMRRLAQEIITDQESEIELMQRWLRHHESSVGPTPASPTEKEK